MPPIRKRKGHGQRPARRSKRYGAPNFADLPRFCRHKILENCSISTLISIYRSCRNLRKTVTDSPTIVREVFNKVYDFIKEPLPPSVGEIIAADPLLHPLFATAIVESYDGYDLEGPDRGGLNSRYLVFLIHRCRVVHEIDIAFSRAGSSIVEGMTRKMALMAFWRMLDCIKNWTKDKKANDPSGGGISSDEYFGWCVDIVGGFEHMIRTEKEKHEISETVGFFYSLGPEVLIKGWAPERPWAYLGWRVRMLGFLLLGGPERISSALKGKYYLHEMREESGLEIPFARGVSRWIAFEKHEREKKVLRLEEPGSSDSQIGISDDSNDCYSQLTPVTVQDEAFIELSD